MRPLEIGGEEHVDAEQARAHAGKHRHHIAHPGRVPPGAEGTEAAGGHLQPQQHHNNAQHGLQDPRQGKAQQQRAGHDAAHVGQQQRQHPAPVEAAAVFPGDVAVDGAVHEEGARGDEHIVQPHGQDGGGDQGVAEADETLDGVGQQLGGENEQNGFPGKDHGSALPLFRCTAGVAIYTIYHILRKKERFFRESREKQGKMCLTFADLPV